MTTRTLSGWASSERQAAVWDRFQREPDQDDLLEHQVPEVSPAGEVRGDRETADRSLRNERCAQDRLRREPDQVSAAWSATSPAASWRSSVASLAASVVCPTASVAESLLSLVRHLARGILEIVSGLARSIGRMPTASVAESFLSSRHARTAGDPGRTTVGLSLARPRSRRTRGPQSRQARSSGGAAGGTSDAVEGAVRLAVADRLRGHLVIGVRHPWAWPVREMGSRRASRVTKR